MSSLELIVCLFPVVFMFHEFEEIILLSPWMKRNADRISKKYPRASATMSSELSSSSFALGIAEEFILLIIVMITALFTSWYYLWLGLFIAFVIHLFVHCVQAVYIRGYVPAVATSVALMPISLYLIAEFIRLYKPDIGTLLLFTGLSFAIMVLNLRVIHRGMAAFEKWLRLYQGTEKD